MWRIWISALFWGLNWSFVKLSLNGLSPWTLRAIGLGTGGALLAILATVLGRSLAVPAGHRLALIVAATLSVTGFNIFVVFAQVVMPASRAAILTFTMPLWATVFAAVFIGEPIDRLRSVALVSGMAGLVLLAHPYWPQLASGTIPLGLVFVLGAAVSWAAGTVYIKWRALPGDPLGLTAWQLGIASVTALLGALLFETPQVHLSNPGVVTAFALHVTLGIAVAYFLWFELLARVPSSTAALGTLLVPIFALIGAMAILGERPTGTDFSGFALILLGVGLDQGLRGWRRARAT